MTKFEDQSPEAALERMRADVAAREEKYKADVAHLEEQNRVIRDEAIARDKAYAERLAVLNQDPAKAIENLERSFSSRAPESRSATIEEDTKQAAALFGKGSDGAAANRLALQNLTRYRHLRKIALATGRL